MPRPSLDSNYLAGAIQWEKLRLWYFQRQGINKPEINELIDHYFWRIQQPESDVQEAE